MTYQYHQQRASSREALLKKSNHGELAIQEAMNDFALTIPPRIGVFLFEDHKIARAFCNFTTTAYPLRVLHVPRQPNYCMARKFVWVRMRAMLESQNGKK